MSKIRRFKHGRPFLFTEVRDGMLFLCVRQATNVGYIECLSGGVFDAAYPESELRRARVKEEGRIASAIMANGAEQYLFYEIDL